MQKFLVTFLALAALAGVIHGLAADPKQAKYFIKNTKSLDYKLIGDKEEHRFGVEVKENEQFHHTITADDGVRLGCYGYELNGKKFSTSYVADAKGYRLVPKHGQITVHPKDGSEPRKASFDQSFKEEGDVKGKNLHYVFPQGCEAPFLDQHLGSAVIPIELPIVKKDDVIEIPETTTYVPDDCSSICCDNDRPQIILPAADAACQKVAKLVVPIEMHLLEQIPIADLTEVTGETNPAIMLLKLLRLLEKCKMM